MKKAAIPRPKEQEQNPFQAKQKASGLCSCCRCFETCTYPKDPPRPTLQCEEFDGIVPSPLKTALHAEAVPAVVGRKSEPCVADHGSDPGLCSLCENRPTCTYPKPEGGVWHCEEYR